MNREREIYKVTLVGSAANVLLTAFKFVAGIVGHSAAMTADAVHSLSDLLTDAVVLLFVRISGKPEDCGHDYGHGKYETLATTLIGIALAAVAVGIGYHAATAMLFWYHGGTLPAPGMLALWAALVSVAIKELVYQYTVRRGRDLNSPAVQANAWHHRSDALSSLGTLVGIGGAILLGGGIIGKLGGLCGGQIVQRGHLAAFRLRRGKDAQRQGERQNTKHHMFLHG